MIQECSICRHSILSSHHKKNCITVLLNDEKRQFINNDFQPMMTYGLRGCIAMIIIIKRTNAAEIIFVHTPILSNIIDVFKKNYNDHDQYQIIIKAPGEYIKCNAIWTMKMNNEAFFIEHFNKNNVDLHLVPYSTCHDFSYENTKYSLYIYSKNNELYYLDNYGRHIKI